MAEIPEILRKAKAAPLFKHVGEAIEDKSVKAVSDWTSCLASRQDSKWINIGTTIGNRISAAAETARGAEWFDRHWNPMVIERKAVITQILGPALRRVMRKHKLPKSFEYAVVGDFLKAWLLTEYKDALATDWNNRRIYWYLAGHVPCGFTGAFPCGKFSDPTRLPDPTKGKLLVF